MYFIFVMNYASLNLHQYAIAITVIAFSVTNRKYRKVKRPNVTQFASMIYVCATKNQLENLDATQSLKLHLRVIILSRLENLR